MAIDDRGREPLGIGRCGENPDPDREHLPPADADQPRPALVGEEEDLVAAVVDELLEHRYPWSPTSRPSEVCIKPLRPA